MGAAGTVVTTGAGLVIDEGAVAVVGAASSAVTSRAGEGRSRCRHGLGLTGVTAASVKSGEASSTATVSGSLVSGVVSEQQVNRQPLRKASRVARIANDHSHVQFGFGDPSCCPARQ